MLIKKYNATTIYINNKIFFHEIFTDKQIKRLSIQNGFTKDLILFYDCYYKVLHHLGRLNEVDAKI